MAADRIHHHTPDPNNALDTYGSFHNLVSALDARRLGGGGKDDSTTTTPTTTTLLLVTARSCPYSDAFLPTWNQVKEYLKWDGVAVEHARFETTGPDFQAAKRLSPFKTAPSLILYTPTQVTPFQGRERTFTSILTWFYQHTQPDLVRRAEHDLLHGRNQVWAIMSLTTPSESRVLERHFRAVADGPLRHHMVQPRRLMVSSRPGSRSWDDVRRRLPSDVPVPSIVLVDSAGRRHVWTRTPPGGGGTVPTPTHAEVEQRLHEWIWRRTYHPQSLLR